jgi:glutamate-1-semialdehyde 2,1-aminomutase
LRHEHDYSAERWTIDEPQDLEVIRRIFEHFHPRRDFGWIEVMRMRAEHPEYFEPNRHVSRTRARGWGTGQKLWRPAPTE